MKTDVLAKDAHIGKASSQKKNISWTNHGHPPAGELSIHIDRDTDIYRLIYEYIGILAK